MSRKLDIDVVIFGGGVAGLWTLNYLSNRGYDTVLIENAQLGKGQTIATQGIIHGGGKYLLLESRGSASFLKRWRSMRAIRKMPEVWGAHLNPSEEIYPDLSSGVEQTGSCYFYRSKNDSGSIRPLLFECLARSALATSLEKVRRDDAPKFLSDSARSIYSVSERTIEARKLLSGLASPFRDRIIYSDTLELRGSEIIVRDRFDEQEFVLNPHAIVLAAGSGNEILANQFGISANLQRRPLKQVYLGHPELPEFWAHCIDRQQTRATFTTHPSEIYERVWQIGGTIAEEGVKMRSKEMGRFVRKELSEILSGLELPDDVEIGTFSVDRAEPATEKGQRPSGTGLYTNGRIITAYPTKLVLAPQLAQEVYESVSSLGISKKDNVPDGPFERRTEVIADYPWDKMALEVSAH